MSDEGLNIEKASIKVENKVDRPLLSSECAFEEASRCLQCYLPPCSEGCPAGVDIPAFIRRIREGDVVGAAQKIKESNILAGICGNVCPVEKLCEKDCTRKKIDRPVSIAALQSFAVWTEQGTWVKDVDLQIKGTQKIAIIGSGPAGIGCAYELAKEGLGCTMFEKRDKIGGVPVWGIPDFRIPASIVQKEMDFVRSAGFVIRVGTEIEDIGELLDDYECVFIAQGLTQSIRFPIEGNGGGIIYAMKFLENAKNGKLPDLEGKVIAVIGGGDVALDVARTVCGKGADTHILYRRTFEEMPAEREEIDHAINEGVNFKLLTTVSRIEKVSEGHYIATCQQMKLSDKDISGRKRPIPIESAVYKMNVNQLIVAIGSRSNAEMYEKNGIRVTESGGVIVDEFMMTSRKGVFAGGDILHDRNTVVDAVAQGKRAAFGIINFLGGDV